MILYTAAKIYNAGHVSNKTRLLMET